MSSNLTNIIFPSFCFGCTRPGYGFCYSCLKKYTNPFGQKCLYCGSKSLFGISHRRCKSHKNAIDAVFIFYSYKGLINKILKRVKYSSQPQLLNNYLMFIPMEQLFLLKKWLQFYRLNIITHIPLFKTDHIQRGFNQSEIIARFISQKFGLKHICLLKKIKKTKKQSQIEKKLRRKNINGVFTNLETAAADSVLLVDDVITTGATVTEAAATLLAGGVKKVFALSLFGAF